MLNVTLLEASVFEND